MVKTPLCPNAGQECLFIRSDISAFDLPPRTYAIMPSTVRLWDTFMTIRDAENVQYCQFSIVKSGTISNVTTSTSRQLALRASAALD